MRCPFCSYHDSKVIDSRTRDGGQAIRRRRECLKCRRRFTTREHIEEIPLWVTKQDGRRQEFDRQKLIKSIRLACSKRPVSVSTIEQIVNKIENDLRDRSTDEIDSTAIGEAVMAELRELDEVAYVRFASVYRNFQVKEEFLSEVDQLKQ